MREESLSEIETMPEILLHDAMVERVRSALLIIDMQEYFREMAQPICENLKPLIQTCHTLEVPVLFTQQGFEDPEKESGMLGEWWGDPILVGTDPWRLMPELTLRRSEKVIRKKRYNAFYGTDLETELHRLGVVDLIIGGVLTNLCCETTARDAFVRDFRVFFLTDGTATVSEEYHMASLKNLGYGFAYLKRCRDVVLELTSRR